MMATEFPDISTVDVSNGADMIGFGRLIVSRLHENGRIVFTNAPSRRQKKIIDITKLWLSEVEKQVDKLGVQYRTLLLDIYDFLYRYVYHDAPDASFLNRHRSIVVDAFLNGNKEIDAAETVMMISIALQRSKTFSFINRAINLHDSLLRMWVNDFTKSGSFFDMSLNDAVRRALVLIREDLKSLVADQKIFKQAVVNRISLIFNNFIEKDSKTLEAMLTYLSMAKGSYISIEKADSFSREILQLLCIMPEVNKFDRMAYACDIERNIKIKN